ncbi:sigma-70-like protein [Solirubrobacter pauli]|uniref:Sigma-70-like protein n=1 Tax=Solirubrobacter pauli TaxID=166793 RepID=A0A660L6R0_9ACTN|nr:sigma factor-like helix-turn-helix DNA-binding protein [Solirubrobacter pauli]RKQ87633.1 sigma-70-like protein [Solirubrobacter pauli]
MPASRATAFDRLAPDQRAAVELVLRQGRSYGELSDLLGMPEETIRTRARGGLAALAPDLPAPTRSGEIADWLLGQQSEAHAKRTRELLLSDPTAHAWAATVAAPLREAAGGEAVPALPTSPDAEPARVNGKAKRGKPAPADDSLRAGAGHDAAARAIPDFGFDDDPPAPAGRDHAAQARPAHRAAEPADRDDDARPRRADDERGSSSRLGGALLIGAAVVVVAVVIAFVLLRGDDEPETASTGSDVPTQTATPATTAVGTAQFALRGPAGSSAIALGQLFRAGDDTVRFAIAGQGIEPNADGERYSIWLTRKSGKPLLLGDVNAPVGRDGQLTAAGPGNDDTDAFVQWLQTYDSMAITLDAKGAKEPGKVIVTGPLPTAAAGG